MPDRTRILFLARRFPPSRGGIQTFSYKLWEHLSRTRQVRLHALGREHLASLCWFVPRTYVASLIALARGVDLVYFSDGVIACLAPYLRPFTAAPFVVTVHGLELTFAGRLFRRLVDRGVNACDCVCAVGERTAALANKAGVPKARIRVVYNGIEPPEIPDPRYAEIRASLERRLDIRFGSTPCLLSLGRQVGRKGIAEFLERGVPLLQPGIHLILCGAGPEHERITSAIDRLGQSDRVHVLGVVDDDVAATLRRACDLFLMPNIRYPNDFEGFGIAPLEAMHDGLPVVAFAVDALVESCREGGYLIPEADYAAFVRAVHGYLQASVSEKEARQEEAAAYVRREYSWRKTGDAYIDIFDAVQRPDRADSG